MAEQETESQQHHHLLTKLNATLISIVKQEWTTSWQNFISDICGTARHSQSKCENALNILKLLSEEVFDFSKNTLQDSQAKQLKTAMTNEFGAIFELCMWVLNQSLLNPQQLKQSLVRSCLKTLQAFFSWIPFGYIFETPLIELILNNFIVPNPTRIEAIKCFTEIASLDLSDATVEEQRGFKEKICLYFCLFISKIAEVTKGRPFLDEFHAVAGSKNQSGFENFCRQVTLAITAVVKSNINLIEETANTLEPNQNIIFL